MLTAAVKTPGTEWENKSHLKKATAALQPGLAPVPSLDFSHTAKK